MGLCSLCTAHKSLTRNSSPAEAENGTTVQVLAAPTGSGKTGVMELAILGMLSANIDEEGTYRHRQGRLKAVYLAPSKALVQVPPPLPSAPSLPDGQE